MDKAITSATVSPRQRAALAATNAEAVFSASDSLIRTCDREPVYGGGVERRNCPRCDKPSNDPGHMMAPDDLTIELANNMCAIMRSFHGDLKGIRGEEYADAQLYKQARKASVDDESTGEEETEDAPAYTEYVVGVMAAMGPDGSLEYYVACSGFKPTPAFKHAYRFLKAKFASLGYLHPSIDRDADAVTLPCVEAVLDADRRNPKKENTVSLDKVGNIPGSCAAAQLIQCAVLRGAIPVYMREIWISRNGDRMGKGAVSCTTCKNNLQPMLCGLAAIRARRVDALKAEEVRLAKMEQEEEERRKQESESRHIAAQAKATQKAAVAKQTENLQTGPWLTQIDKAKIKLPSGVTKERLAEACYKAYSYFQDDAEANAKKLSSLKPKDITRLVSKLDD